MTCSRTMSRILLSLALGGCFNPGNDEGGATEGSGSGDDASGGASTSVPTTMSTTATNTTATTATADDASDTDAATTANDSTATTDLDSTGAPSDTTAGEESSTGSGTETCGNAMLDAGELCDDGVNAGLADGDCATDCSTSIDTRLLVLGTPHIGALESLSGAGDLPERVDSLCPVGYKSLFAYGGERTASVTAFAGDGQVDWALRPWTRYELEDGTWIGTTDAGALLGVRQGAWIGLENPIAADATIVWTGMRPDYTSITEADEVCDGFSNAGVSAWAGDASLTDLSGGSNFLQDAVQTCILQHPVLCADQ